MRNACRSSSPSSTLPRIASTRVTCAVRPAGTVRPGAHEANRRVLARRVLGQPRASAADGDDVTGEFGLVASRARFQVAKLLHALETVVPAEEGDNGTLSLNAQLLQHLWRDRLTQDHAVEPRSHPGGRAAAWRTGHEAERGKKSQRQHGVSRSVQREGELRVSRKFHHRERENKKTAPQRAHLSSGSGGPPPTGLADVGCSPPARRRGTGELGVPLPAAPAAAAALPDLPASRPPAGADPLPAAAQRTLSPACAPRRTRGRRDNHQVGTTARRPE